VYGPLHMQWMGIWNHRHPVTTAVVDPDFDSRLKASVTLGYKPYHYAVVEAPYPSKAACTSIWSKFNVCEPLHMQRMGIWNHSHPVTTAHVDPWQSAESLGHTAGLQTMQLCSGLDSIPIQSCLQINVDHI